MCRRIVICWLLLLFVVGCRHVAPLPSPATKLHSPKASVDEGSKMQRLVAVPPTRTLTWLPARLPGQVYLVESSPNLNDWAVIASTTNQSLVVPTTKASELFRVRTQTTNGVTLVWDPSPSTNVLGYKLYYESSTIGDAVQMLDVGSRLTATVTNLVLGKSYVFYATAYDYSLVESEHSNHVIYQLSYPQPATLRWSQ